MKSLQSFDSDLDSFIEVQTLQRSRLFTLSPIGIGTPNCEGLLSLIVRTCRAHAVNPRRMITELFPLVEPDIARLAKAPFFGKLAGTINGLGQYAELFVSAMEKLSGHENLRELTMLPWQDLFPHNGQGLLARQRRWCPTCLDRQESAGTHIPFPLAWSLEVYSVCPEHLCNLEEHCPHCGKVQPFLPRYPDLSICDHCRMPLGSIRPRKACSDMELWLTKAVGDMILRQCDPEFHPDVESFRDFLREQVVATAQGNRAEFCREIGLAQNALNGWFNKDERSSITQFLSVCYGVQALPTDVFKRSSPLSNSPCFLRRLPGKLKTRERRSNPSFEQRKKVEATLINKIEQLSGESVSKIATELGVGSSCLRYWFPDLCAELSKQHRIARRDRSIARQEAQCRRLEEIFNEIVHVGHYPSRRRINGQLVKESMSLAQEHLNQALRKLFQAPPREEVTKDDAP